MIILIINNKPYHYEIIETVINKYYEILNIKKQKEMPTFFLEIKDNAEFSNYIKEKYSNIKINNHIFFGYDYLINCSIYSSDYEMVKNQSSSKNYYICHDVTYEMKKFTNVRFLTPLSSQALALLCCQPPPESEHITHLSEIKGATRTTLLSRNWSKLILRARN